MNLGQLVTILGYSLNLGFNFIILINQIIVHLACYTPQLSENPNGILL